jgi:glycine dehydrogenase
MRSKHFKKDFLVIFENRHIGPNDLEQKEMLQFLGAGTDLNSLTDKALPESIRSDFKDSEKFAPLSESELLQLAEALSSKNEGYTSVIGQGYYNTLTPSPILRGVLENPGWYTAYTPYQAEISQGRMEALINYQTMVTDLTCMELSNSSLLDEGTALSEAVTMSIAISNNKSQDKVVLVEEGVFVQSLSVLKTRMKPLNIKVKTFKALEIDLALKENIDNVFCVVAQSPSKNGQVLTDLKELFQKATDAGAVPVAATDLMACLMFDGPGRYGAEIVVGSSQRFGVPLGNGGPHAAFLATKEKHKRLIPGRIVGVSKDSKGKMAYRLALQTREQHIRREKATSNICTAQVLLAVVASMYAVYHGPKGLRTIAERIKKTTDYFAKALSDKGHKLINPDHFFDTLSFEKNETWEVLKSKLKTAKINVREDQKTWGFSVDESWDLAFSKKFAELVEVAFDEHSWREQKLTKSFRPVDYLEHKNFNSYHTETELMRYMKRLENKDFSLTHGMIPLGSCTMKLNAATEMLTIGMKGFSNVHPFAPKDQMLGYHEMIEDLNEKLCAILGFSKFSFQPNSGAQGELAGLFTIKDYHLANGGEHRNICLVPASAHGTNPASAVMSGFKVVPVGTDSQGNIDLEDLKQKISLNKGNVAALMITYPSTHGVYESSVKEICKTVHEEGGLVYMDGANMNALVGLTKPADLGVDVSHLNLHKTFCIPHGGGGPGVGPIGVVDRLKPYLPTSPFADDPVSISAAEFGSASILPISWAYIRMMGFEGLKRATQVAVLNANYVAKKLKPNYKIMYTGQNDFVAHECIIDTRIFKDCGVTVDDFAKRLIDYGFHAPTMSWPVVGTLMIEPTESENKAELDRFCEAMNKISEEVEEIRSGKISYENSPLKNAPHSLSTLTASSWDYEYSREKAGFPTHHQKANKFFPTVDRVDNAYGDRNLFCTCPPIEDFA